MPAITPFGPQIGLWGTFDVASYGALLGPRIFELEMRRRLPFARVHSYSPLGHLRPIAMDGGRPAVPLGEWSEARCRQLADQLDLVAIGGGELIHVRAEPYADAYGIPLHEVERLAPSRFFVEGLGPELERRYPVVWHAVGVPFELRAGEAERVGAALASKRHVSVCDAVSHARLVATGTDQEIAVVPDPAVLVNRLFAPEILRKRLEYLQLMGWYPEDEAPLVLQGDASLVEYADEIGHAVGEALCGGPLVVIETSPADAEFADAVAASLPGRLHRMPAAVTLEDLVTGIAHARAFVGSSVHAYSTALAFGRAGAFLDLEHGFAAAIRSTLGSASADETVRNDLTRRLDAHFDMLAVIAEEAWAERAAAGPKVAALARALAEADARYEALLRAYDLRGERLVAERLRFAEIIDAPEARGIGEGHGETLLRLAELRSHVEVLEAQAAADRLDRDELRAELKRVRAERDGLRAKLQQASVNAQA